MKVNKIKAVYCPHCGAGKQVLTQEGEVEQSVFKCERCNKEFDITKLGLK